MKTMSYRTALNQALLDELGSDPSVFIFGLDVDDHKSIFGSTEGLLKKFGSDRVFGTPLSEDAMTGFAIGCALRGKKPVHVHIRADFLLLAVNQLMNLASNIHYISAGQLSVPLTIRAVIGRGWGQGVQHSKSVHAMFSHVPGIKVIMPCSPQEAYTLLRKAIQDPSPVIFLEHRWLYDVEGQVDKNLDINDEPLQVSSGQNVTVITNSWMTIEAMKAQEVLNTIGISIDLFNISHVSNSKMNKIYSSVKKTRHCIVAETDWNSFGFNSEISTLVHENNFIDLKQPVRRIGQREIPCPTARVLEDQFYPKAQDIIIAVCKLLEINVPELNAFEFYSYENKFKGPF